MAAIRFISDGCLNNFQLNEAVNTKVFAASFLFRTGITLISVGSKERFKWRFVD
jgi:hypothetical protein